MNGRMTPFAIARSKVGWAAVPGANMRSLSQLSECSR
jgi:hypothetical protein